MAKATYCDQLDKTLQAETGSHRGAVASGLAMGERERMEANRYGR